MNTLERIDRLFEYYFGTPIKTNVPCNASKNLDLLDDAVGIDTRWLDNHTCRSAPGDGWTCGGDHNYRRYVGARLALHESFMFDYNEWETE